MQTLSSASRTCMASASAVECTATVGMPSSLQARKMRSAISPRLAMRILSNIGPLTVPHSMIINGSPILHRLTVLDQDLDHGAGAGRRSLIYRLHRFDDDECIAGLHLAADIDERLRAGRRTPIGGADHRGRNKPRMFTRLDRDIGRRRDDRRVGRGDPVLPAARRGEAWITGDADRRAVRFDLDLGKTGFVEQLRQLAIVPGSIAGVFDVGGFRVCGPRSILGIDHLASIKAARPSIASA